MNYQLFLLINGAAGRADNLDDVMEFVATWLIYPVFGIAALLSAPALLRRHVGPVIQLGVALMLAFSFALVLSHVNGEVRPFQSHRIHQLISHEPGVSLPSDHATAAFALAFGVYAFSSRRWGVVLIAVASAIGFARVWVGVHYPGDIAAGAVIGGLAVLAVVAAPRLGRAAAGASDQQ